MEIRVSGSVIIVLLFALVCWKYCSGKMELCSNSLTGFGNGTTIPATVGEPVTVSFCVQWEGSDETLIDHIKIEHPNYPTYPGNYYTHSHVTSKLMVDVVVDKNTARINITITRVEQTDLRNVFAVELATKNKGVQSDARIFTFQLKLADQSASPSTDQSTSASTSPNQLFSKPPSTDPSHRAGGQTSSEHESELNVLHIALPPIGFIIIVVIIFAIVWCRVKGTWKSRSRAGEMSVCGNDADDNGEVLYANVKKTSAGRVSELTEVDHDQETDRPQYHDQEADRHQYCKIGDTAAITDTDPGRVTLADGLVYTTVMNATKLVNVGSKRGKQTQKHDNDDDGSMVYLTLDFEKTGKIMLTKDNEKKEEETGEQTETQ